MVDIVVKKGLDIPIEGKPAGDRVVLPSPKCVALDISGCEGVRLKVLKKEGEKVAQGEPLCVDKEHEERVFLAPASGTVKEIVRGEKRRVMNVAIEVGEGKVREDFPALDGDDLVTKLGVCGLFSYITVRPGGRVPMPSEKPEAIFVRGLETAPFAPPPEWEVEQHGEAFEAGLSVLEKLAPVHLVTRKGSKLASARGAACHTASGPHPAANVSVHMAAIHPIVRKEQIVWELDVSGVIAIGMMATQKKMYTERIVAICGVKEPRYVVAHLGQAISELSEEWSGRVVSGDPLMGREVGAEGYLGYNDHQVWNLPNDEKGKMFHFMRPGFGRYSATRTYPGKAEQTFSTMQHGEERPFVDGDPLPKSDAALDISVIELVKALLAEDFEKAEELGLLEVAPEDFALPSFVCPSKIPMTDIVRQGLKRYVEQVFVNFSLLRFPCYVFLGRSSIRSRPLVKNPSKKCASFRSTTTFRSWAATLRCPQRGCRRRERQRLAERPIHRRTCGG